MKAIQIAEEIAREIGGRVYPDYSGRGMFGKTCLGITCNDVISCVEIASCKGLKHTRTNDMGKSSIVYWPDINPGTEIPETKNCD